MGNFIAISLIFCLNGQLHHSTRLSCSERFERARAVSERVKLCLAVSSLGKKHYVQEWWGKAACFDACPGTAGVGNLRFSIMARTKHFLCVVLSTYNFQTTKNKSLTNHLDSISHYACI